MRFKTGIALAVGFVGMLALSIPAFSRPSPQGLDTDRAPNSRAVPNKKNAQRAITHIKPTKPNRANQSAHIARQPAPVPAERPPGQQASFVQRVSKSLFGRRDLVSEARKYMGTNPTDRKRLWCATFMNMVLAKVGYSGTNSDAAKSFAQYGHRISEPKVGAIAVLTRGKRGGHVGVVSGIDAQGNPIIISGNHNKSVGESVYPRARVIAYVMPSEGRPVTTEIAARSAPNASSAASRAASEPGIDSPITELLAAIEKEQARPEVRAEAARPRAPQVAQAPQAPPVPYRAVQQVPEETPQSAQGARRTLPLDPSLAEMLGIKDRAQTAQPPRPLPQRQQPVQQRQPGRIAAVDTGAHGLR